MTAEFNAGAAITPGFPSWRTRYAHCCLHKYLEQLMPNPGTSPIPQRDSPPGGLRATLNHTTSASRLHSERDERWCR